ncbi:hypothetical protein B296_00023224 [Ensete ventricosum]|uniref:Calponin-homology (CH) domain-containing protein n=1 Tax=Ensete ventricosum TaxID=4639 RepID=A0A426ZVL5_ENSVE|nr:hypothetical protein B296_00023224 [Ensete ventricosum]
MNRILWFCFAMAAMRRYEAAEWLRKMVGVAGARDLPEEPTEEEFLLGLRNGIVLCNALNKVQPGAVPKVVEAPADSALLPDGAALSAYQYFENLRNFLVSMEELGLPTFEAVVNCVLALKSYGENKQMGRNGSCKYGGILKPSTSGKYFVRRNSEPFMNSLSRSQSNDKTQDGVSVEQNVGVDFSMQSTEMVDKKPEEVPVIVESMLSRVMQEFERRIASQNEQVGPAMMQERVEIDLQDLLRASDSSLWPEDSLRGWEGDNLHMPDSFYQGYVPDVMRVYRDHHGSRANSIATDDSDDLDFATSDSSEQDMLSQYNLQKSNSNAVNGGSKIKRPQPGPVKSSETR